MNRRDLPMVETAAQSEAQALAERVRAGMYAKDAAAHALGMQIKTIAPGRA